MSSKESYLKRWITGLILGLMLLAVILCCSEAVFAVVVTVFIFGGVWEYNSIVFGKGFVKEKTEGLIFALAVPLFVFLGNQQQLLALLAFSILFVFILFFWSLKEANFDFLSVTKVVFGMMYIPFLTSYFILMRKMEQGHLWVVFALLLAIVGDIAALYTGRYLGKHKLIPLVSPGKTVEGLLGLVSGSTLTCLIFGYFLFPQISLAHLAILGFVGSIIGQLGDLCESAIKRKYGLKDAGAIIPGHGGLLDRMDCLIFVAPFVYYYRIFVIA
jgi:phosphatidate cytidylyltransferase